MASPIFYEALLPFIASYENGDWQEQTSACTTFIKNLRQPRVALLVCTSSCASCCHARSSPFRTHTDAASPIPGFNYPHTKLRYYTRKVCALLYPISKSAHNVEAHAGVRVAIWSSGRGSCAFPNFIRVTTHKSRVCNRSGIHHHPVCSPACLLPGMLLTLRGVVVAADVFGTVNAELGR